MESDGQYRKESGDAVSAENERLRLANRVVRNALESMRCLYEEIAVDLINQCKTLTSDAKAVVQMAEETLSRARASGEADRVLEAERALKMTKALEQSAWNMMGYATFMQDPGNSVDRHL